MTFNDGVEADEKNQIERRAGDWKARDGLHLSAIIIDEICTYICCALPFSIEVEGFSFRQGSAVGAWPRPMRLDISGLVISWQLRGVIRLTKHSQKTLS